MRFLAAAATIALAFTMAMSAVLSPQAQAQDSYTIEFPVDSQADEILAAIVAADAAAAAAAADAAAAAAGADEVLGITQTPGDLAFTGSSVSVPAAVGAGLIGLGGLTILAARKRETSSNSR